MPEKNIVGKASYITSDSKNFFAVSKFHDGEQFTRTMMLEKRKKGFPPTR
jgi:hypothetical protein